ncbi:hypothetical protein [Streptomyces violaceus]|uniref:Uncharacterized protein n=1 Tax=Streptomyces violaceus TaxID=1936 RepID=A0ABY9UPI9_STRVL|nr:hypothetical protein [Streptomyces janthinus]WND24116.1 hypothetical protein RI060_43125 [Streptomyces janthinus]GGS97086.1 hypothetical protein GCM10010270_81410 [Streptomyces janthinus]
MTSSTSKWDALQKRLDGMPKPTKSLTLCADPDIQDRYLTAKKQHTGAVDYQKSFPEGADEEAKALVDKQVREASAELDAAQKAYKANSVTLTFQALERGQLEELQAEHPATEEDEELGRDFHFDTFAPALISAANADGMPLEYATHAMKTWSLADSQDLWNAAWSVQQTRRSDLGKG